MTKTRRRQCDYACEQATKKVGQFDSKLASLILTLCLCDVQVSPLEAYSADE